MDKLSLRWIWPIIPGLIFIFTACEKIIIESEFPQASQGILDLREWDFQNNGSVRLSGEYEFYWRQFLSPEELTRLNLSEKTNFINIPSAWNEHLVDGKPISGQGYATYRLSILFDEVPPPLALKFLDMGTAFTVFANGEKLLAVGAVASTEEDAIPAYVPQVVNFTPDTDEIELVYHVSNFHHNRGGAWEVVELGLREDIYNAREKRLTLDFFLVGALMIICLYHIALFVLRPKEISTLYFAAFCFFIGCRILATMERFLVLILPNLSWEMLVKFEYLVTNFAAAVFGLFLHSLFRQHFSQLFLKAALSICAVILIVGILLPASICTVLVQPYQVFVLVCFIYGLLVVFRSVRSKQNGAVIFLIGYGVMFITGINDLLDTNAIIHTGHFIGLGLFGFVLSQAILLAIRFSKAFGVVDLQRQELAKANADYSRELQERVRAEQNNKELEEKLQRSQKMEALGMLAGEVAHDLNNVLSGIVSYPDLLLTDLPKNSPLWDPIQSIRDAGLRAASIVQDLLTMVRRSVTEVEVVNLNRIVDDFLHSPEYEKLMTDYHIPVVSRLEPDLLNIKGSELHLKKTVMNLITNAAEAQPDGGMITIHTHNRYVDRPIKGYDTVKEGDYAVLSIEDKGIGIAKEDLKRIFEPFYTRKRMGRSGTGLGMTIAWRTIQDHKGYIDVQSDRGQGTVFELYFPIVREEIDVACLAENNAGLKANVGEVVMIVDDVKEQRLIASLMLRQLGYVVMAFASGEEAVEYLKTHSVDLVLLDMIMEPGIDGLETYERIRRLHPAMKAVIASGYAETQRVQRALELGVGQYIKKPYTMEKIGSALKAELQNETKSN